MVVATPTQAKAKKPSAYPSRRFQTFLVRFIILFYLLSRSLENLALSENSSIATLTSLSFAKRASI